jgi:hypothetical protein
LKKLFTLLIILFITLSLRAQTRGFGYIDTADLKLTSCDFEKDANAMVLFDKAKIYFTMDGNAMERHRRIKILNEKGKGEGDIKIEYHNLYGVDHILKLEAQTINLDNGKIIITKVDPKSFYAKHTDQSKDAIVFSFPDVKPGSVLEYRYTLVRNVSCNFPAWYFQSEIPTRYSEFSAYFDARLKFKSLTRINQPFLKDSIILDGHLWSMDNIQSSKKESYMRSQGDALESISLVLTAMDLGGKTTELYDTWSSIGKRLANEKEYYKELDQHLPDEEVLIKKAAALNTEDEKISFLFNEVKSSISWNGSENWKSNEGIKSAWKRKSGNTAEINAILYHLLKKSGIKAYPMLVSTRENGSLQRDFVNMFQINSLVAYVPVDGTKFYVLDATNKYNTYNETPFDFLNSYGLCLDKENDKYDMIFIEAKVPAREIILVDADISTDAKMKGTGEVASYRYNRTNELEFYKTQGEKKFEEFLTGRDNNIKISNLKLKDMEVDTLPLTQSFEFTYDLNNSDNYIFFCPNIFTSLHDNPFLSEKRNAGIDFGYGDDRIINGRYKIPKGYVVESLPKNANIVMADKGIKFKRMLVAEDGYISVRYEINVKRTQFKRAEYPDLYEFYKRMYEMLNEQIVLKKS